jgi:hypothetical protein
MSTRRQIRAAVPDRVEHEIPDRLLTCYVEDWCNPGSDPIPDWRGAIRPGTCEWVWHWQLEARHRQREARNIYLAEHGLAEPLGRTTRRGGAGSPTPGSGTMFADRNGRVGVRSRV